MSDNIFIEGRIVVGHPMKFTPVMDDDGKTQKTFKDGSPRVSSFIAVAIPKGAETDWKQTVWGAQIHAAGVAGWTNGMHVHKEFAWKITDGDSIEINKKGVAPNTREGFPGHWVVNVSANFPYQCCPTGKYMPQEQIKDENQIKTGDYVTVVFTVSPNGSTTSPGMYVNPQFLEFMRAGEVILSANAPDVNAIMQQRAGGGAQPTPQTPTPQVPAPTPQTPAPQVPAPNPTPPPATDLIAHKYEVQGTFYTGEELIKSGWTQAQIDALPQA